MLISERSKPEFLLVDDSSHVISECPRAPGNRAFLCHCGLQWRRTNRNHISIKCSRKLLFDSQIESPRSAFSARRPTTTLAWRLGTRVSSQLRKSRCSMSKPVNFPVNTCHNNSLKLVQENSGKPSESILIYLSPPPPPISNDFSCIVGVATERVSLLVDTIYMDCIARMDLLVLNSLLKPSCMNTGLWQVHLQSHLDVAYNHLLENTTLNCAFKLSSNW